MLTIASTVPDIRPSVWNVRERDNQDRDVENDGWTQINTWEPANNGGVIWRAPAERNIVTWDDQTKILRRHWLNHKRAAFSLFNFHRDEISSLYVATGNGVLKRFTLPAKFCEDVAVFIDAGAGPVLAAPQPV